ncbi:hypothetical protein [Nocardioides panzhihuensis]|uniref:Uncharacterized protein n=1 Tax=Nocardioides panzhihuensis TaxID=860243 RepID=A0A7Z0DP87_9ACTN|nr:hypothetical protein [Nocardioides panzhihuensis]NYI79035.1 hypothetical protein [Nocardioides panzhihuensis]
MEPELSKNEIRKDVAQSAVEVTATTVGQVTMIITGAVKDVAVAVGGLATELFELRAAAKRAEKDLPE